MITLTEKVILGDPLPWEDIRMAGEVRGVVVTVLILPDKSHIGEVVKGREDL